jgi:thiol-disulfide isomerase/thioredoxin
MRSVAALCIWIPVLASVSYSQTAADSAWRHLQGLNDEAHQKVPIGVNAFEFSAGPEKRLHDAAVYFVKQFPGDPREPEAMLWKIDSTEFPAPAEQRIASLRENEIDAKTIINNPAVPANLRYAIERIVLTQWLDNPDLITSPSQAADLEERIQNLVEKNGAEPRIVSLELARANLLLRFDHAKGVEFLENLIKGPEQDLAAAAKAQLQKAEMIGKPVAIRFLATDGSTIDTQALHGKVVLVDFWASWCPDCIREMPSVRKAYQKYRDKGLVIVGVSLDTDEQALANFVAKKLIPWPQCCDGKGWESELAVKFGVRAIPEMWLINQEGTLLGTEVPIEQLDQKIAELLGSANKLNRN